jgi:nicotinamide mononucleotide transporter
MKSIFKDAFTGWKTKDYIMVTSFLVILLCVSFWFHSSWISILMGVFGIIASMFNLKKKSICFFFFFASSTFYMIICYINHLYGDAVMNTVYFVPLYGITIIKLFTQKKEDKSEFTIGHVTKKAIFVFIGITIAVSFGYGYLLKLMKSDYPFINAFGITLAMAGCYFSSRHWMENWVFWILYNVILIGLWVLKFQNGSSDAIPVIIADFIYIAINLYGWMVWLKLEKEERKLQ